MNNTEGQLLRIGGTVETRTIARTVVGLLATVLCTIPASAQPRAGSDTIGSIGLTASVLHVEGQTSAAGLGIDGSRRIARARNGFDLLIVGDLVVNHFSGSTDYDPSTSTYFTAGLRLAGRTASDLTPFVQFLAGGVSCCGATDKAVTVGAGLDVPVKGPRVNVRVQVDVPLEFYPAGVDTDGVKYGAGHSTGVRARFGVSVPLSR